MAEKCAGVWARASLQLLDRQEANTRAHGSYNLVGGHVSTEREPSDSVGGWCRVHSVCVGRVVGR